MAKRAVSTPVASLEFVGPPRRLIAVGTIPQIGAGAEVSGPVTRFMPADGPPALRFSPEGRRGAARLRLRLDARTPPGAYEGAIGADKATLPFVARVLPETRVSLLAGELAFSGPQGATPMATLALANDGNTEITLPRAFAIGLFDDDGLETAFAASYVRPIKGIDAFVETFHGKLREAHSGILKLAVTRGYGPHAPGTSFAADFALEIGPTLRPGHRYHGVASTEFADLPITVTVINGAVK
ncbi:hypothetical protein RM190_11445 [Paracoccus sp. CPCC 101403]|uniref:Uncharacterized protein n=2 Tax=Paracoccus broussonetiae TaxID=3075834 RepID=A0ABU3EG97_9RHOB|nr:hypothetical protein [Paracoccus sp. CPCC 101403]MDT1062480.1 hypothetical protein [Paracoccus sp. CPCC 101403]